MENRCCHTDMMSSAHHAPFGPPRPPGLSPITAELFSAARGGSAEDAASALAFGAEVNARNSWGYTPLMYASWAGFLPVAGLLLRMPGIEVNARCPEGMTPIHFAVSAREGKSEPAALGVVSALLAAGGDVNARTVTVGDTPAMRAAASRFPSVALHILQHPGCDVGARDVEGRTVVDWVRAHCCPTTLAAVEAVAQRAREAAGDPAREPPE